jgi:hypothetical protein
VAVPGARRRVFYFWRPMRALKIALEGMAVSRPGKSRQTSPRDPGAFRWTRNQTFFDNRKAGKSTPTIVT